MAMPTGIGSGNGRGLAGQAIMAMAKVWLTCLPVPPPPPAPSSDCRGFAVAEGTRCPRLSDWCGLCGCSACLEAAPRCGMGIMLGCGGLGVWVAVDGDYWCCTEVVSLRMYGNVNCPEYTVVCWNISLIVGVRQDDIQAKLLVAVPWHSARFGYGIIWADLC